MQQPARCCTAEFQPAMPQAYSTFAVLINLSEDVWPPRVRRPTRVTRGRAPVLSSQRAQILCLFAQLPQEQRELFLALRHPRLAGT